MLFLRDNASARAGQSAGRPCANFLEREFEDKRRGFLAIRRGLFLLIPGIAATYFGGGRFRFANGPLAVL